VSNFPEFSTDELVRWLQAKYRRHGEIEDGIAAERLKSLTTEGARKEEIIESINTQNMDRWNAWWEMRDEFECSKGPFTSGQALEIMDSYETIEMDKYRKSRDSVSDRHKPTG